MKKRLFSFTILFIASLLVGFRSGVRLAGGEPSRPVLAASTDAGQSAFPVTIRSLGNGQRSILVVVANSLQTRRPKLESAWLLIYVPSEPHLTFLPIYPTLTHDPFAAQDFERNFKPVSGSGKDRSLGLNPAFLAGLQAQNLWWSGYILLDERSFAEVYAHFVDNVPSSEQKARSILPLLNLFDTKQDLTRKAFTMAAKDPEGAIFAQAKLYEEICWSASQAGSRHVFSTLQPVIQEQPEHAVTDMDLEKVLVELEGLRKRNRGMMCEFPTVSIQIMTARYQNPNQD